MVSYFVTVNKIDVWSANTASNKGPMQNRVWPCTQDWQTTTRLLVTERKDCDFLQNYG